MTREALIRFFSQQNAILASLMDEEESDDDYFDEDENEQTEDGDYSNLDELFESSVEDMSVLKRKLAVIDKKEEDYGYVRESVGDFSKRMRELLKECEQIVGT